MADAPCRMPPIRKLVFLGALLALATAAPSPAAPHTLTVGASESASLIPDPVVAKARMDLAVLGGLTEIEVRADWTRGKTAPTTDELAAFQASALAAQLDAVRLVIAVSASGSRQTPLSLLDRKQFAQYTASLAESLPYVRDFIVGNEPNLNRFWMPQFDKRGRDLAAPAYEALLARTYDALKMVSPHITVIGGAVSPRGADRAKSARHPYGETSKTPPTALHPKSTSISIADYPKLVTLLRNAFRGTAQQGASLPILYGEYGVQTAIPFDKLGVYTNLGSSYAADAVSEARQGAYYARAIRLAYCQRTVAGLLFFLVSDEPDLDRWQSGLFYADDTPKSDLAVVKNAARAAQTGTLTCPRPKPKQKVKR